MQTLFALIWIRYFMVSERVEKTFVNGWGDNDNSFMHIAAAGLGAIILALVLYANQSDKDILMAGKAATTVRRDDFGIIVAFIDEFFIM